MTNVVLIMSPPGGGKSRMIGLTAPKRPLHVFDIDRKMTTMAWAAARLESGDITVDELKYPLVEASMATRTQELVMKMQPTKPEGWAKLSEMFQNVKNNKQAMAAGSWSIDSFTLAASHLERLVGYHFKKDTWEFQQWGAFFKMLEETVTILIDAAKEYDKDIYFTIHEKEVPVPGKETKVIFSGNDKRYVGQLDIGVGCSVAGSFGSRMPMLFTEVYALKTVVNLETKEVTYKCVVKPDGMRPLRTSYDVGMKTEFEPDFRKIWGLK